MGTRYHRVLVTEVVEETPDAKSFVLEIPAELSAAFAYRPGQFLTVRVSDTVARCYSLSSSPHTDTRLKFTVKRVPDGRGSNWLCDNVRAGAQVDLLPPAGSFTPGRLDGDLLLLAGGSGITPVISIIKSVLSEGDGRLALVYANRDEESVIFAAELRELAARHPGRLVLHHWLDLRCGFPTVDGLRELVRAYAQREVFICGPEPFMAASGKALAELGVPDERVHVERFQLVDEDPPVATGGADATAVVTLDGETHRLAWPSGAKLLDVIMEAGLNPPYSCRQGICGACACRKLTGEVHLMHNEVLEDEDFADGYILACQALPRSETVEVTYE
ncbi:MAG TPA: ferredoxin--NADP reductase [Rugosimonospora sp.]|nr:ferredoxin--NADP reductase [Rugosimonospora sp.]